MNDQRNHVQRSMSRMLTFSHPCFIPDHLPGEAGLCGLPVVCTDVGGSREVLSDTMPGESIDPMITYGRIVPPRSPGDLVRVPRFFYSCAIVCGLGIAGHMRGRVRLRVLFWARVLPLIVGLLAVVH